MFDQLCIEDALHAVSQGLQVPTIICLLALVAYAVYTIGSLVVEYFVECRHYLVALPRMIAALDACTYDQLGGVIAASGLLGSQKEALRKLADYAYLPEDSLEEVAKRLLSDEKERYQKALSLTDSAVKIAPMLGLMGTLIPLGPGIVALGTGELETLSSSLLVAFDTTIAGLVVAVVCYLVTRLRRRWYAGYLVSLEGGMNAILEKAFFLREQGAFDEGGPYEGVAKEAVEDARRAYAKAGVQVGALSFGGAKDKGAAGVLRGGGAL